MMLVTCPAANGLAESRLQLKLETESKKFAVKVVENQVRSTETRLRKKKKPWSRTGCINERQLGYGWLAISLGMSRAFL